MIRGFALGLLAAGIALAQPAHVQELKKIAALAGQWKGEGWMQMGPGQRHETTSTESVRFALDGAVLVVEGKHYRKEKPSEIVHDAIGLLSWDPQARQYAFYACTAARGCMKTEAKSKDGGLEWGMQTPGGTVRYFIDLSDPKKWHETGELSRDGATWMKFFEMNLTRVE